MKRLLFLMTVVVTLSVPHLTRAQWSAAPHLVISVPTADFANISGTGGGFGIKVARDLGRRDGFGLWGDFSFLSHGKEFTTVVFSGVPLLAEVRQQSFRLGVGPQYVFGSRHLKFQLGATGGFYVFKTTTDINTGFGFFQDQGGDAALGWKIGGGLQYDIGIGPWLDVSFEYNTIYNITTESTAETAQDGVQTTSTDITGNEILVKVGVIFFIR